MLDLLDIKGRRYKYQSKKITRTYINRRAAFVKDQERGWTAFKKGSVKVRLKLELL
jgi:hypothetical protein